MEKTSAKIATAKIKNNPIIRCSQKNCNRMRARFLCCILYAPFKLKNWKKSEWYACPFRFFVLFNQVSATDFCPNPSAQADLLQLLSQTGHIDGQGVLLHIGIHLPQFHHQCFPTDNFAFLL